MKHAPILDLADGNAIPQVGLGTWKLTGDECIKAVLDALEIGYRHIDTADYYGNHKEIGKAIAQSDVKREAIFITTKVWRSDLGYDAVIEATNRFLEELQLDYIDLLLVHWPNYSTPVTETLEAMQKLKEEGKIKSIGVSNFTQDLLEEAGVASDSTIVNNQIEEHVELVQEELINYCFNHQVSITAYSPLAHGRVHENDTLKQIGEKHGKTASQIALHYLILRGMIIVPKSGSKKHIQENFEIFDIKLSEEEMDEIRKLNTGNRYINPGFGPWNN